MNRLDKLFQEKKQNVLSIYFTAGYPNLESTRQVIENLEKAGADVLEIGVPFSDSLVDGETIQASNTVALANGMSLKVLFSQLEDIRKHTQMPLILMGYYNQTLQYGFEKFCQDCQKVGIDGLILPDIPVFVYKKEYKTLLEKYGLYNIFLITPQTSDQRILEIDAASQGFLYVVSSASTTGAKTNIQSSQESYFQRLEKLQLKSPKMIGFGISDHKTFSKACEYGNGAIIGSAFIKAIGKDDNLEKNIQEFVGQVLG